ncbi:MAG TPA: hypothetical protein VHY08_11730 [Bacillota bacterium]|nr:hypothetical protein [Bacillota bacterium]
MTRLIKIVNVSMKALPDWMRRRKKEQPAALLGPSGTHRTSSTVPCPRSVAPCILPLLTTRMGIQDVHPIRQGVTRRIWVKAPDSLLCG